MIRITVRPKEYTRGELKNIFARYSEKEEDFEDWLSAMQTTGQLIEKGKKFYPATMPEYVERPTRQYKTLGVITYGGKKTVEDIRVAIRARAKEMRETPTDMHLIAVYDKDGKRTDISEKPRLVAAAGRGSERRGEVWRANIPAEIRRKYNIKPGMEARIRIEGISKQYFSRLILWGYSVQAMISFGETGKHQQDRDLELHGWEFPYEVQPNIREQMALNGVRVLNILRSWVEKYDPIYSEIFLDGGVNQDEISSPNAGVEPTALVRPPRRKSHVQFRDLQKGRTIAKAEGSLPRNWYELSPDDVAMLFTFPTPGADTIGEAHGYKGRKGTYKKLKKRQITLDEVLKNKEGFK